jgi:hypothetical protein
MPISTVIITTNYDMALELYFMQKGIKFNDGFKESPIQFVKEFDSGSVLDPFQWYDGSQREWPWLIKLHGSIWQFEQNEKMIKTILPPENAPIEINVGKEMMIYPTKEKEILNCRYYPFFNIFKNLKWTYLLVIGYSFRDEPINTAIIENMRMDPTARMIVMDPNPEAAIQNLNGEIPENRIVKIRQPFGEKAGNLAISELKDRIRNRL